MKNANAKLTRLSIPQTEIKLSVNKQLNSNLVYTYSNTHYNFMYGTIMLII